MKADVAMTTTAFRTARAMPPRWGLGGGGVKREAINMSRRWR